MVRRDSMCGKEGQNGIERKKRRRDGGGKKINGHTRNSQAKATEGSARGHVFF